MAERGAVSSDSVVAPAPGPGCRIRSALPRSPSGIRLLPFHRRLDGGGGGGGGGGGPCGPKNTARATAGANSALIGSFNVRTKRKASPTPCRRGRAPGPGADTSRRAGPRPVRRPRSRWRPACSCPPRPRCPMPAGTPRRRHAAPGVSPVSGVCRPARHAGPQRSSPRVASSRRPLLPCSSTSAPNDERLVGERRLRGFPPNLRSARRVTPAPGGRISAPSSRLGTGVLGSVPLVFGSVGPHPTCPGSAVRRAQRLPSATVDIASPVPRGGCPVRTGHLMRRRHHAPASPVTAAVGTWDPASGAEVARWWRAPRADVVPVQDLCEVGAPCRTGWRRDGHDGEVPLRTPRPRRVSSSAGWPRRTWR